MYIQNGNQLQGLGVRRRRRVLCEPRRVVPYELQGLDGFSFKKAFRSIKKTIRQPSRLITKNPMMMIAAGTKDPKKIKQRLTAAAAIGAGVLVGPAAIAKAAPILKTAAGGLITKLPGLIPGMAPQAPIEEAPTAAPVVDPTAPPAPNWAQQGIELYRQYQAMRQPPAMPAPMYDAPAPAPWAGGDAFEQPAPAAPPAQPGAAGFFQKWGPAIGIGIGVLGLMVRR